MFGVPIKLCRMLQAATLGVGADAIRPPPRAAAFAIVLLVSIAGCTMATSPISKEQFAQQVGKLLDGRDSVVVPASALTEFPWQKLCFTRDETLLLTFTVDGAERVLSLPYEAFFIDEGHVANSLEDACLSGADRILVKKKYPGYAGPIEFQKSGQAG